MSLSNNTASLTALLSAVNALPDKVDTSGTAVAADIYAGKTATVNDVKLTGSNPYNASIVDPAVANALAALAEKGVDTSGKGLADIAGLIASIKEGGGGVRIATGTYSAAEDITMYDSVQIALSIGFIPKVFIFYIEEVTKTLQEYMLCLSIREREKNVGIRLGGQFYNMSYYNMQAGFKDNRSIASDGYFSSFTEEKASLSGGSSNPSGRAVLHAGAVYNWIAISDWEG